MTKYGVVQLHKAVLDQGEEWGWAVEVFPSDGEPYPRDRLFKTEADAQAEADRLSKLPE